MTNLSTILGNNYQGQTGTQGSAGAVGSQGAQGYQGAAGSGSQGAQGYQGAVGSQGAQGAQGYQGATFIGGTLSTSLTLAAGNTTAVPLDFQTGTLATTPAAGNFEYDGSLSYFTPTGTARALIPNEYFYRKNTSTTLTSGTGNQSILGLTNGVTVATNTIYEVSGEFQLTTTGTTSHTESFGFVLTTATLSNMGISVQRWASTATTATGGFSLFLTAVAPTAITGALTTSQTVTYRFEGTIAISTGGSVNPVIAFSAGPGGTSTIVAGAWCRFNPIGTTGSAVNIGTWA